MPAKPNREYRSFALMQPVDSQAAERGYIVEGYATTFDDAYELYPGVNEVIKSTALIGADMSDVIFQLNHEGTVLARMRNQTLQIDCDEHGMKVRADLGGSQAGRDLYESIKNGLIDRMSWGFMIAEGGWEYDSDTRTSYVTKVDKVFDVSAVSIPANEGTDIHARSYLNGVIEQDRQELSKRDSQFDKERIAVALSLLKKG